MALPHRLPICQPAPKRSRKVRRRLNLESLEPRLLFAADVDPNAGLLTHGGACSCPICSGVGLSQYQPEPAGVVSGSAGGAAAAPIAGLPQLSSRPGAAATIYLDFDGHTEASWGSYTNVVTRVYDTDGDDTSFSASEISAMTEIWSRVAEDFAPFNINVTTVEPGSFANGVATRVAIGGNYSDWFGSAAGGVAYIGGFYNSASNVAYVFEDALGNGNAKYVAEAASHEAGHTFGLQHQSVWSGGVKTDEYNPGSGNWAPIMGVGYYSDRTTWHQGTSSIAQSHIQDDLAILTNSSNGFGYRTDDFGDTVATASALTTSGGSVNIAGLIGTNSDWDVFEFTTSGGALNLSLNVAQFGANLDSVLELLNSAGQTILSSNPSSSFGASLATTLAAGTYYVGIHSSGGYGNLGTYTLSGTVPGGGGSTTAPEISLAVSGTAVADGGTVSFGSTSAGTAVDRTVTITNTGNATLNLTALSAGSMPAGFSLVSNIGTTALGAGQSTSFTVRLTAASAGSFSGAISLTNSDGDESPYDLTLSGVVNPAQPQPVVRYIDNGASGFTTTGTWYRITGTGRESDLHRATQGNGTTTATWTFTGLTAGQYRVAATWPGTSYYASNAPFTILNGSQSLGTVLANQRVNSAGFTDAGSNWTNLGTFTITGNTLTVRLTNAANGWTIADAIRIESVGEGEPQPSAPEIGVDIGGTAVSDGGTVNFGSTAVGTAVSRTFTVRNTGDATLTLNSINANSLPAGFTLVSNLASTSLAPGQSTTFAVSLNATAAGTFGGTLSIGNNDSDESPYDLQLSGVVSTTQPPSAVRYIDNGATGFTKTGTWYNSSTGREGDSNWALNGSGTTVATWSFTGLTAGQYRVSATWPGSSTYASDAPYSVYNGTALLGTSRVSQKVASSGFADGGSQWRDLGNFTITGTTLVVKLANNANGWVVADGIRIERIGSGAIVRSQLPGGTSGAANLAGLLPLAHTSAGAQPAVADSVFADRANDSWLQSSGTASGVAQFWHSATASQRADFQPELAALEHAQELLNDLAAHLGQPSQDLLANLWE